MTKRVVSGTNKSEWLMLISTALVGFASLILGVMYVQIAQGNPWWRIGGPIALFVIAGCIWLSECEERRASQSESGAASQGK
jgi:hypothetical protein